jgi:hypothetical protein
LSKAFYTTAFLSLQDCELEVPLGCSHQQLLEVVSEAVLGA